MWCTVQKIKIQNYNQNTKSKTQHFSKTKNNHFDTVKLKPKSKKKFGFDTNRFLNKK